MEVPLVADPPRVNLTTNTDTHLLGYGDQMVRKSSLINPCQQHLVCIAVKSLKINGMVAAAQKAPKWIFFP